MGVFCRVCGSKRLRESDQAFNRFFPKGGLEEFDAKRLRKLAADLGVHQGDRTKETLTENLRTSVEQRQEGHDRRAAKCALAGTGDDGYGSEGSAM